MKQTLAYWLCFFFGSIFGACAVVALAAVLASQSGAGYQSRHVQAASR